MSLLRLALAQINPTVGALRENRNRIASRLEQARRLGSRVALFPELVLTGYPPEDLLTNAEFVQSAREELESLLPETQGILAIIGLPWRENGALYNAAALLLDGRRADVYFKGTLPNYGVFDEKRYFRPGLRCPVYRWGSLRFGVNICEDLWTHRGIPAVQVGAGARLLLNISSSPYHAGKGRTREDLLRHRARQHGAAIAYVNLVGGQDELVFDGESLAVDAAGNVRARAPQFTESLLVVDLEEDWLMPAPSTGPSGPPEEEPYAEPFSEPIDELENLFRPAEVILDGSPGASGAGAPDAPGTPAAAIPQENRGSRTRLEGEAEIYAALRLGVQDYVHKNGFDRVVIGLSGGIDSALTAAVATDALGAGSVVGVSMPSRYNSPTSRLGAREVAASLGIRFLEIPIDPIYRSFLQALEKILTGDPDVTEENIQARVRGTILMALSNKWRCLVLTTGNKSELGVGYCTLYGDMAGGFAVIKDVPKTLVYRLARYRNTIGPVIPQDTLTRLPSAELRENQCDQDVLPPYEILDRILEARMEREEDPAALVRRGLDPKWVGTVYGWIDSNEYKRRQAPPGIKITPRAFGRDRRYPITNHYRWEIGPPPPE